MGANDIIFEVFKPVLVLLLVYSNFNLNYKFDYKTFFKLFKIWIFFIFSSQESAELYKNAMSLEHSRDRWYAKLTRKFSIRHNSKVFLS